MAEDIKNGRRKVLNILNKYNFKSWKASTRSVNKYRHFNSILNFLMWYWNSNWSKFEAVLRNINTRENKLTFLQEIDPQEKHLVKLLLVI